MKKTDYSFDKYLNQPFENDGELVDMENIYEPLDYDPMQDNNFKEYPSLIPEIKKHVDKYLKCNFSEVYYSYLAEIMNSEKFYIKAMDNNIDFNHLKVTEEKGFPLAIARLFVGSTLSIIGAKSSNYVCLGIGSAISAQGVLHYFRPFSKLSLCSKKLNNIRKIKSSLCDAAGAELVLFNKYNIDVNYTKDAVYTRIDEIYEMAHKTRLKPEDINIPEQDPLFSFYYDIFYYREKEVRYPKEKIDDPFSEYFGDDE